MCTRGPHFILCTCSTDQIGENRWRLIRGSSSINEEVNWVGDLLPPLEAGAAVSFDAESYLADRLLFDINYNSIFDFEYLPEEGDILNITFGDIGLTEEISWELIYESEEYRFSEASEIIKNDGVKLASGIIEYVSQPNRKSKDAE